MILQTGNTIEIMGGQMADHPPPRPHTADQACDDLLAFIALRRNDPRAAQLFEDVQKSGAGVIVCHLDRDATEITGSPLFVYELEKTLAAHLAAFRASDGVACGRPQPRDGNPPVAVSRLHGY